MRIVITLLLSALASIAAADDAPGITTYPASYFADGAPATAADMVARLPGFRLVDADEDVRGYAAAQGNVLIDGARPSSKRESIDDLLERIPARSVERIEIIRAGAAGHDLLGQPMLANIVRGTSVAAEAALEGGALLVDDGGLEPLLTVGGNVDVDDSELEFALGSVPEIDDDSGVGEIVEASPAGGVAERSASRTNRLQRANDASATWRRPTRAGTLSASAALRDTRDDEDRRVTSLPDGFGDEISRETEHLQEMEFGLQCSHTLGAATTLDAVASHRVGWLENRSDELEDEGRESFAQDTRSRESLARIDLQHARSDVLLLTAGAELAINALDGDAALSEDGEAVELPGSRVRIEEQRGDASVGAQWRTGDSWRLDGRLALERSRIRQTGDSPLARDFTYLKPSLAARYQRGGEESWRLSLERNVGQLAFEDFVASASLDTDVVTAGNAQLEPDKAWRVALVWERTFGRDGALALTLAHDELSDVVDLVPVRIGDEVFDAPGNIGDGARDSLALAAGTSLDAIGWANLRIDADLLWQRSRVRDPGTGARRGISGEAPLEGTIELTQTLAARGMKWGVEVGLAERETEYRVDEVSVERADAALSLFVERAFRQRWQVRAELLDVAGVDIVETRERYDGPRATQSLAATETRRHRVPPQLLLTVRRDMGG
jgi:hypothetical protein